MFLHEILVVEVLREIDLCLGFMDDDTRLIRNRNHVYFLSRVLWRKKQNLLTISYVHNYFSPFLLRGLFLTQTQIFAGITY